MDEKIGINIKSDADCLKYIFSNDLKDFKIEKEDFDKAIDDFMKDRKSNTRKPIGYNKQ